MPNNVTSFDPEVWEPSDKSSFPKLCKVCGSLIDAAWKCARHEKSKSHLDTLAQRQRSQRQPQNLFDPPVAATPAFTFDGSEHPEPTSRLEEFPILAQYISNLGSNSVEGFQADGTYSNTEDWQLDPISDSEDEVELPAISEAEWAEFTQHVDYDGTAENYGKASGGLRQRFADFIANRLDAIDDLDSDIDFEGEEVLGEEGFAGMGGSSSDEEDVDEEQTHGRKRARASYTADPSPKDPWFPWPDKISCTYDILTHLPRSQLSESQQELLDCFLSTLEVDDVPSRHQKQHLNERMQKLCGLDSHRYSGALGHIYYLNDLSQIIAQEFANPLVRPHMHFYPEDTGGKKLSEARHGSRWLNEAPDELLTPMARLETGDFYIHEPAMLRSREMVMPTRWFMQAGVLHAKCWRMVPVTIDGVPGWRVVESDIKTVRGQDLLLNFPELKDDFVRNYGGPPLTVIHDVYNHVTGARRPWTLTDPQEGNRWRAKADGKRVVSLPLWLYCDDTSGNVSKKWNKHNSWLFTPASLPREETQKEFNIHFLGTSNLAPPLEMLDGVVEQFENIDENGILAWDCENKEYVLVMLWILAFLGDNPMQSEFACHIGMRGRRFCRACKVEGKRKAAGRAEGHESEADDADEPEDALTDGDDASDAGSDAGGSATGKTKRRQAKESLPDLLARISRFVEVGEQRSPEDTRKQLDAILEAAKVAGSSASIAKTRTMHGIKDTYQLHFIERLEASYKKKPRAQKQPALDAEVQKLPQVTISPVWRIKGLDPHGDTPVEVLHVILLGFLRYMWRDLVGNQIKSDAKKEELMARLFAIDVRALGLSRLAGKTLVQFAGSLTGRDFRVIAQVAPFVIYDMVSPECYKTWLALARLVPLVWQPVIENPEDYLVDLTESIDHFLLQTAKWTCRWFNKPKFHILLHLPNHIRRFGPAMLFATEAFESFNAVIRTRSVHSNHQAPSRDIARSFARANCIRHLASGGFFRLRTEDGFSSDWVHAGSGLLRLMDRAAVYRRHLGIDRDSGPLAGSVIHRRKHAAVPFNQTSTSAVASATALLPASSKLSGQFMLGERVILLNGDDCRIGFHVIHRCTTSSGQGELAIARLEEILSCVGSHAYGAGRPSLLLLRRCMITHDNNVYGMPRLEVTNEHLTVTLQDVLGTVNTQHNCAANKCTMSGQRHLVQEREVTVSTTAAISHRHEGDLIVNTAQMRNAALVATFRSAYESLAPHARQVLRSSAEREFQLLRARAKSTAQGNNTGSLLHPRVAALTSRT